MELQLEVSINGQPAKVIGAFWLDRRGRLWSTAEELRAIGIDFPGEGRVPLDAIEGLSYRYDERSQFVSLSAPDSLRRVKTYGERSRDVAALSDSMTGLVLNYSAFTEGSIETADMDSAIDGGSLSLDGAFSSGIGTLTQSGILGTTTFSDVTALRLETMWSYADETNIRSYRAGDVISGGLAWTTPIRIGGAQVQRNFGLRPGLVTTPLPSFSGSAAVPSTVDVYVGSVKTYSQQIEAGPYRIDSLPVITGSGTARIIVTDATGREQEENVEFFSSANLLGKGLIDYSIEAGVARRDYGTTSFGYGDQPLASASLRYGVTDWLTAEAHGETDFGMANGGLGFVAGFGRLGEFSAAIALSQDQGFGGLAYAAWNADFGHFSVSASSRRVFGDYSDLASVTATDDGAADSVFSINSAAVDQISLSYGFPDYQASAGLGLVHVEDEDGARSLIVSGTITKAFDNRLSVFASAFTDVGDEPSTGAFIGFSMPLGPRLSATASGSWNDGSLSGVAALSRTGSGEVGGYGWRVAHGEGDVRYTDASASYRARQAYLQAGVVYQEDVASFNASADGALVVAGGGIFASDRISDAYAIVDVGAPGVPVRVQNRMAGKTGGNGKTLVAGLNAYEKNKIAIDIDDLPVTASVPKTEMIVVPREKSGVRVDFGVQEETAAAIVTVVDASGKPLAPGTALLLAGSAEPFVVGFDGEVYLTGLSGENAFEAAVNSSLCRGSFRFKPSDEVVPVIGPVPCA